VVAEVEDTGCGIAEADLPRIWDPFFSRMHSQGGTGLGLPVARKIVDLHGGAIEIVNRRAGGVRVTVGLRACKSCPAPNSFSANPAKGDEHEHSEQETHPGGG
jgi:signal transduction histidine kinase